MAKLTIEGGVLTVSLSALEKLGALASGLRVPLSQVAAVRVTEHAYDDLRGVRVGTGLPYVIVLGRMIHGQGTDFVALYGTGRTVVIDLTPEAGFRRILLTGVDAATIERLREVVQQPG